MRVRYGRYREGETVMGDLATKLIADGMAVDVTPKAKKAAPAKKAMKAAPENKADDGFDPDGE
jgi:hypothetical protein